MPSSTKKAAKKKKPTTKTTKEKTQQFILKEEEKEIIEPRAALLKHRTIHLCEPITMETTKRIVPDIMILAQQSNTQPITLVVSCPGGSYMDTMAIVGAMMGTQVPIHTLGMGYCFSGGSLILACGVHGRRIITRGSWVMIHQALHPSHMPPWVDYDDSESLQTMRRGIQQEMLDIYVDRTKLSRTTLEEMVRKSTWIPAEKAVEYGFADMIAG